MTLMAGKTVLHLGAGPLMCHSIRLLREDGYTVFTVDGNPRALGFALSAGYEPIDFSNADAVVDYARRIRADLILGVNEPGVWTAALASERLGLPNVPVEVAWRCLHKGKMRQVWAEAGLLQPQFRVVDDLQGVPGAAAELGYPLVLKPTFGWGSRGVSVIFGPGDLEWSCGLARDHARQPDFIIERCVSGVELTVEGLVRDSDAQVLAISDKQHQKHDKYRVAMALDYPPDFPERMLAQVRTTVKRAVAALGLENGAFHCECMVNDEGVQLLELGARGGGGHIFGVIVEAVSGVRMPTALVRIFLGEDVDIRPRYQHGACYRFFAPPRGVFEEAVGIDEAKRLPGILDFGFEMAPGTVVGPIEGDADRPGFVVSAGATRAEAIANANRAIASVRFRMAEAGVSGERV